MKYIFSILFCATLQFGFSQIIKTVGISYTNGTPTYTPAKAGSALALDTVTWRYYTWNGSTWLSDGFRVQTISGCSAPAYTPTKFQSHLVINACAVMQGGPELYYWTGLVWLQINEGQTYTAGTGIAISGGNIISSTITQADGSETKINVGTGISKSGTGTTGDPYLLTNTGAAALSGVVGQVPYFGTTTTITTENSTGTNNLYWNSTSNLLGIGTASPSHRLHISGTGQSFKFNNAAADGFAVSQLTTNSWAWSGLSGGMFFNLENSDFILPPGQGSIGIGTAYTTTPTSKLDVVGSAGYSQLRLRTSYTPTSSADALGNTGDTAWDANYFYIKTAAGWKRTALSTF